MATTIEVHSGANTLASVTIPDSAITEIKSALGGTNNAETAQLFLALVVKLLRPAIRSLILNQLDAQSIQTAGAVSTARENTFNSNW